MNIFESQQVSVRVPATSANCGSGFDSVGLALSLYDDITARVRPRGVHITMEGEGSSTLPADETHLVVRALRRATRAAGVDLPGIEIHCVNRIPQSRGLGSSAAAVVGGLCVGNALSGGALSSAEIIALATEYEGHPDNAAAAVLGQGVVSWMNKGVGEAVSLRVHPDISAVAFIPDTRASTADVRRVLPESIPHTDARFAVSRAALLPYALEKRPDLLMIATQDKLHEPYREAVLPESFLWIKRLRAAGYAAFLSGAGSTVLALVTADNPMDIAIMDAARAAGLVVKELTIGSGAVSRCVM